MIRYACPVCSYVWDLPERPGWEQVACNCPDCLMRDVKVVKLTATRVPEAAPDAPAAAVDKLRAEAPVVHVFETMISFSIPDGCRPGVHEALNAYHGWVWVEKGPAPAELVDAAWRACANHRLPVRVVVRSDGRFNLMPLPGTSQIRLAADRDRLLAALKDLVAKVPNDVYGWEGDVPNPIFNAARAAIAESRTRQATVKVTVQDESGSFDIEARRPPRDAVPNRGHGGCYASACCEYDQCDRRMGGVAFPAGAVLGPLHSNPDVVHCCGEHLAVLVRRMTEVAPDAA